jgi:hypothetical protein
VETGIIRQLPDGGFTEAARPVTDEERAVLEARSAVGGLPAPVTGGVPAAGRAGVLARLRIELNGAFTETAAAATEADGQAGDREDQPVDGQGKRPASETHRAVFQHLGPGPIRLTARRCRGKVAGE